MNIPDIIIAIDGYSSTGKSSFAKIIANEFSFLYLDSGALYRGVTLFAIENGFINDRCEIDVPGLEKALQGLDLHFGEGGTYIADRCIENEIRSMAVADKVSPIATVPQVREFVDRKLREFGAKKRVVMTADPLVRARRRAEEMAAKGDNTDIELVLKNLQERDYIDSHRETSPLTKADDAIVLDNSDMTMEDQLEWIKNIISDLCSK